MRTFHITICVLGCCCALACGAGSAELAESAHAQTSEVGAAGGGSPEAESPGEGPRELSSFPPELGLDRRWTGDLDAMAERGYLRALVVYSKTHYFLDGARPRGLSYEGLKLFEEFLNRKLQRGTVKLHVVMIPVRRDKLLEALEQGLGDLVVANLTVTPDRLSRVDFSRPFTEKVREVVVTGPAAPAIQSLDDLAGMELRINRSSSYWSSLEALSERLQEKGLEPIRLVPAEDFLESEDLLEMVNAGVLPLTVVDDHIAGFWADVLDQLVVRPDLVVREGGAIAWAMRKNSPQLAALVNEFVGANRVGTLTTNILLKRYLKSNPWVRNPTATADRTRFEACIDLFRTYGEKYDFDPLMLAALAYQESRLDQSVRSHVGAVGVMQILPSTAADSNVGIPDVEKLESNIHAGTKYLRFIRDRYFADPGIDPINRTLFAFAAYNAGPARVRQLRAEAAEKGLDPNRWFGNVELVAARRIGRETVTYVSNIAKYNIAYQLVMQAKTERRATGTGEP